MQKSTIPEGVAGDWRVERFTISEQEAVFAMLRYGRRAPSPGTYTRLVRGQIVVMSDTRAEIGDHAFMIWMARGSVLVNGLGLGYCVAAALAKSSVTDVTVIERSSDVISLVAPSLQDERLTIIQADALTWRPPKGKRYGVVWHDIWDHICEDNLPEMHTLHRRYGRRCDWQGSWCRAECERLR